MKRVINFITVLTVSLTLGVLTINAQTFGAGNDFWVTDPGTTYDDVNLPANAIAPGSLAYQGRVYLAGDPQNGNPYDTSIRREQSVRVPASTTLNVDELNLKSVSPLSVDFSDGSQRNCDMLVTKSPTVASKGSMSINSNGTFSSNLKIIPKLTFVCSDGLSNNPKNRTVTELDTGSPLIQAVMRKQAAEANEKIKDGTATAGDLIKAQACVEPVETFPQAGTKTSDATPTRASCGIQFAASGPWTVCTDTTTSLAGGGFCIPPGLLAEIAALARHGVFPRWLGTL